MRENTIPPTTGSGILLFFKKEILLLKKYPEKRMIRATNNVCVISTTMFIKFYLKLSFLEHLK
jgi:hypothetical protein